MNELKRRSEQIIEQWREYDKTGTLPIPLAVVFAQLLLLKLNNPKKRLDIGS